MQHLFEENGQYFTYDGENKIYYEKHGTGSTNMLCIHGFASNHRNWYSILPYILSGDLTVYLIDLKGGGKSSTPKDGKYAMKDQAAIITSFIVSLKINNPIIMGHSMGGGIGLCMAIKENAFQINKLILIDTASYKDVTPLFVKILTRRPWKTIIPRLIIPTRLTVKIAMDRIFYDKNKVTPEIINHYLPYFYKPAYYHPLVKTAEQLLPEDYNEMLEAIKQIDIPTLIIWAQQDPVLPVEFAERLNKDIRNSKLMIIDKCGHVPQEEKPGITAKSIIEFIEK